MRLMIGPEEMLKGDRIVSKGWVVDHFIETRTTGSAWVQLADGSRRPVAGKETEVERPVIPAAVAVDSYAGFVFYADERGRLFTPESAARFCTERNTGLKVPTYMVRRLVSVEA